MSEEDNRPTLEGLAQRLEALEYENERMCSENAEFRDEVAKLRGSGTRRALEPTSDGRVSRRWLLRNAGAAALGTVAAGALMLRDTREAKADHYAPGMFVDYVVAHQLAAYNDTDTNGGYAVYGGSTSDTGYAVHGENTGFGPGVRGDGKGTGVRGRATGTGSKGVHGDNVGQGYGVFGETGSPTHAGVYGINSKGFGVWGQSFSTPGGYGVVGDGTGSEYAGVLGRNKGSSDGIGVQGEGTVGVAGVTDTGKHAVLGQHYGLDSSSGNGVRGESARGYGGHFQGGKAQLRLEPGSKAGKPATGAHDMGELYMDKKATLWVCVTAGTPGAWKRVSVV